jgi:hypothetical protein
VVLISLFDRNGDGKIDDKDWVDGGDAFVTVGKDVAAILAQPIADTQTPQPPPAHTTVSGTTVPAATPPGAQQAAANAYAYYGAAD